MVIFNLDIFIQLENAIICYLKQYYLYIFFYFLKKKVYFF